MLKHKSIKLHVYPKKVKFNNEADYGDEVYSVKYFAEIEDCEYREKDIPYLRKALQLKKYINKSKSFDSFKMIVMFLNKNRGDFSLTITPYPDDISDERSKEMKKFIKKIVK